VSALADYSTVVGHLKAGTLRALATGTPTRLESLPDVPAIAETYGGFESEGWLGLVVPASTPKATIAQLVGWFTAALQVPDVKDKLIAQGLFPVGTCTADFAAFLGQRQEEYGRIIRESNMKTQ
jgi:tripartite-type tricarboxylate transporter receptor subunit TctC